MTTGHDNLLQNKQKNNPLLVIFSLMIKSHYVRHSTARQLEAVQWIGRANEKIKQKLLGWA